MSDAGEDKIVKVCEDRVHRVRQLRRSVGYARCDFARRSLCSDRSFTKRFSVVGPPFSGPRRPFTKFSIVHDRLQGANFKLSGYLMCAFLLPAPSHYPMRIWISLLPRGGRRNCQSESRTVRAGRRIGHPRPIVRHSAAAPTSGSEPDFGIVGEISSAADCFRPISIRQR
jgi:hypothetical protein